MPSWVWTLIGVALGVILIWIALIVILWIQQRRAGSDMDWREIARLVPDVVRLVKRLAGDRDVPRGTRWILGALLVYLLLPIDFVPDFLPVIGYADDAIVTALVLRYAIRHAGYASVERNWPGTPAGLASILALCRIGSGAK